MLRLIIINTNEIIENKNNNTEIRCKRLNKLSDLLFPIRLSSLALFILGVIKFLLTIKIILFKNKNAEVKYKLS